MQNKQSIILKKWVDIRYGLDPRSADHNLDADMDDYTQIQENLNQTPPLISNE